MNLKETNSRFKGDFLKITVKNERIIKKSIFDYQKIVELVFWNYWDKVVGYLIISHIIIKRYQLYVNSWCLNYKRIASVPWF